MQHNLFTEGVRPGGLTTGTEIRILLCYLLASVTEPVTRQQLEDVLLGEELANYFAMAESLAQIVEQGLVVEKNNLYSITDSGRTVANTLADELPRTVRDAAVNGVVRAQQFAARAAAYHSQVRDIENGHIVTCSIGDENEPLFRMEIYMPDELTAQQVRTKFIEGGDQVYKLVLAALTDNRTQVENALETLK